MYARITPYKMKPGSKDAAMKIMDKLKDQIMALPGQHSFLNVLDDKAGSGYVVSTTELSETSPETAEKIKGLWANFASYIEGQPQAHSFEVLADWKR
ncbi:hypothetical protein SAMN04488515_1706 [Cognatiyoonia koreensis]|uniref:Antibiotic biosynthesis monooxygenase n=1 Tax=Cognatiyoonia koreensis TaxID=364200 RepID=A0A1I0Q6N2_9RHOB|nr:hypothetical protein [Cognatiyoonia koreensis]SEW22583.1 hypothetical protein SAMN04488515_1706 [Cognatiyoonia koreensis]